MGERRQTLRFDVDERPPTPIAAGLGLQYALFVITGSIFLPIFMHAQGLISADQEAFLVSASLLTGGVSTAVQALRIGPVGSGYMLFMGTSGTFFAATIDAIELAGIGFVAALALIAAPTEMLFAWLFRFLRNIFTPTVGGVVVMCVAITVVPLAIDLWEGAGSEQEGAFSPFVIGAASVVVMVAMIVGTPARYRMWAPIGGLAAGCLAALAFGDWSFTQTSDAAVIGFPIGEWEAPTFPLSAEAFAVLGAFVIATLAGTFETVGDAIAVQRVSHRDDRRIDYDSVRGSLNADGVGNALAGIMCTTPNTTYSPPTSLIPIVGVASRWVGLWGAGVLIVIAFFPVLIGFVLDLPAPAVGGVTFVYILLLFMMGARMVVDAGINSRTALIVAFAFWGGFAFERGLFFPELIPSAAEPILGNAISAGGLIAVTLTALFMLAPRRRFRWRGAASMAALPDVTAFGSRITSDLNLSPTVANRFELCLEELFTHLVEDGEPDREIRIAVSASEDDLEVLATDRSDVRDVERPALPDELLKAPPEALQDLGLILISRMASHVNHASVSGWHYVSFIIERHGTTIPGTQIT